MNKIFLGSGTLSLLILSSSLLAATGEWWEMSTKMEMEGMPFAMPSQTTKVCMPQGGQSDPNNTQGKDRNCKMTDVKQSGNTVKFKGTCVNQGETMTMVGETSHDSNSFKSNVKMTGKDMNMSMVSNGKRIGGSCDTGAMAKKAEAQGKAAMAQQQGAIAKICDLSNYDSSRLIYSAHLFIDARPTCPGKKEAYCSALRKDISHDTEAYETLVQHEKTLDKGLQSTAKACGLNMESTKKALCKAKAKTGPLSFLEGSCPVEAKVYRELQRKQSECAGRGFTGGAKLKQCMGGDMLVDEDAHPAKTRKAKVDTESESSGSSGSNTTDTVLEGAKALKGMFGF